MYKDNIAKYYNITSMLSDTKPLIKILSLLLFSILCIATNNIIFSIILLLFSFILVVISKVPFKLYFFRSLPSIIINAILLVIILLFNLNLYFLIVKSLAFSVYYSSYIYTTKISDTNKGVFDLLNIIDFYSPKVLIFFTILIHFISIVFVEAIHSINIQINKGKIKKIDKIIKYTITLIKARLRVINDTYSLKKYNFKYIENTTVYSSLTIVGSHIMLFFVYLLGKI